MNVTKIRDGTVAKSALGKLPHTDSNTHNGFSHSVSPNTLHTVKRYFKIHKNVNYK